MSLVLGFGLKWLLLVMRRWSLLWVFLVFRQVLLLRFVLFVSKFMVHAHNVASVLLISMPCVHLGLATEWRAPNPDTILIMQTPLGVISTKSLLQTKKKTGSRLISSRRTKIMKSLGTMVTEQLLMVLTRKGQCFQSFVQVPQLSFTPKMELKVSPNQPTCHLLVL
ncbi:uncharacterized protein LOC110268225 [Arachis ipaensis]|uniref:uncharacterized protein LOC110268225 n=1 Tax=Arachis ipaensis TaxID=130454 RepID=UPI000A2AF3FD|nr:uncharacterized protein LOC110268225 [Arachis ipaensis]XP_020969782.1 uncharacterized protein LOC110268225 [Arachis ipaensis]